MADLARWSMDTRKMAPRMMTAPSHWFQLGMESGFFHVCIRKLKMMLTERVMVTREGVSRLMAAMENRRDLLSFQIGISNSMF